MEEGIGDNTEERSLVFLCTCDVREEVGTSPAHVSGRTASPVKIRRDDWAIAATPNDHAQ